MEHGKKWTYVKYKCRWEACVQTRMAEPPPAFSQHVDILANGAPGQNCSALTRFPAPNRPYLWGPQLKRLLASGRGWISDAETVAHALDQARSDSIDSQFERWVRQEQQPPPP
jgi:hypothetical protein